jgi:hypothetical protein
MSDDDMMMSEEEDYGFDYEDASDPEDEDDVLVRLENQYYTAKGRAAEDDEAALDDALGLFREVVDMEEEKGDWYISIPLLVHLVPSVSWAAAPTVPPPNHHNPLGTAGGSRPGSKR